MNQLFIMRSVRLLLVIIWNLLFTTLFANIPESYIVVDEEREALECRIELIRSAQTEILMSTYIIEEDNVGLGILQYLLEAVERGVEVRVLLDDLGNELSKSLIGFLQHNGVKIKLYNTFKLTKLTGNVNRMHGKLLITDHKNIMIGGRNISETYYRMNKKNNFLDREIFIISEKVVKKAKHHFDAMWDNSRLTNENVGKYKPLMDSTFKKVLAEAAMKLKNNTLVELEDQKKFENHMHFVEDTLWFIHDNFYSHSTNRFKTQKDYYTTEKLIELVSSAQHSLDIENPYFIPTKAWKKAFKKCLRRGVKIRLLTNSGYTTDVPVLHSAYLLHRKSFIKSGIEIWEYQGEKMLHTKSFIIDGLTTAFGSYNLDKQSHQFNTEVMIVARDSQIAAIHTQLLDNAIKDAILLTNKGNFNWQQSYEPTKIQQRRNRNAHLFKYTISPLISLIL